MANEIREVLYNDGEGLDFNDLNTMQRYIRSQLWDFGFGLRARQGSGVEYDVGMNTAHCYAFNGGAVDKTGTARQLTNLAGVIMVYTGNTLTGADYQSVPYYLNAADLLTTTNIGDATNPRIDLICLKVDIVSNDSADNVSRDFEDATTRVKSTLTQVKKRKVVLTKQYVVGTPGVTPAEPAVPAGFVKWAGVTVPATHNAVHDPINIRDYRMPVGLIVHDQILTNLGPGVHVQAGGWAPDSSGTLTCSGAGAMEIFPACGAVANGRLISVSTIGDLSGCTVELIKRHHDNQSAMSQASLLTISASLNGGADQMYTHTLAATDGFWMNGYRAGVTTQKNPGSIPNDGRMTTLGLRITSAAANKFIRLVRWNVAACI